MLETSTAILLVTFGAFIMLAVLMVHHHNCSDEIRRKTNEVEAYVKRLQIKKEAVESDVVNITLQIDEIEEEIDMLKEQKPA